MAQRNYLMAIVSYRYSAELDPINPIPYYQLAMALKEHRREGEAEDVLERALELFSFQGNVMGVELVETALHSFKTN
jgi:tetratricopeptide (TPR) repeat protein